jgi:hypothetical protein
MISQISNCIAFLYIKSSFEWKLHFVATMSHKCVFLSAGRFLVWIAGEVMERDYARGN